MTIKAEIKKNISISQGTPEIVSKSQNLGERHVMHSSSQTSKGTNPANTFLGLLAFITVRQ